MHGMIVSRAGISPVETFEKPFFVSDYTILVLFNVND
jgi:hypothetical protein